MENKNNKTPPNWQQVKLADVFDFIRTCSHSKDKLSYEYGDDSRVYNIHYGDIHARYSDYVDFKKDTAPFLLDSEEVIPEDKFLREGDLVMVDASEDYTGVGSAIEIKNLDNKKCIAGLHVFALRDKSGKTVNGYRRLALAHPVVLKRLRQISTYSKVYGISKGGFSKVNLFLSPLPEQHRIVAVLETWDSAIDLLKKKIALKKQVKKGLMQRLLSGEVRLPGFSGEWKKVRLGDVIKTVSGGTPKSSDTKYYENGTIPWIKSGELRKGRIKNFDTFITETGLQNSSAKVLPADTVLIAMYGVTAGQVAILEKEASTNQAVCGLIPNEENSSEFIYHFFTTQTKQILEMGTGAAQPNISQEILREYRLYLPPLKEQQTIASILTTVDKEITLLNQKLHALEQQKKFLLNNLVTGEIRTPEDMVQDTRNKK